MQLCLSPTALALRVGLAVTLAGTLLTPASSAGAAPEPTEVLISAERFDDGNGQEWFFIIEVEGPGIIAAEFTLPTGGAAIPMDIFPDGADFEAGPFTSFANTQASYPTGDYTLTLNGSQSVGLGWDPTEPVGSGGQPSLAITAPAGTIYSQTPDVTYTLDCTNCDDFDVDMTDDATGGMAVSFGFESLSQTPPASVPFSSLTSDNMLTELPAIDMVLEVIAGLANFSMVSLSPSGHSFQYVEAAAVGAESIFTVRYVDEVLIEAAYEDQGSGFEWFLLAEAEGGGLGSVSLTPPTGPAIPLADVFANGEEFDFESSGFASFAALQATYPPGSWTVTVDGTESSPLTWMPPELMASGGGTPVLAITSPTEGESGVSTTPDFSYTLDCANCDDLGFDVFDVPTDGATASFEITLLDQVSFPNPILFSSLGSETMSTELPSGETEAEMLVGAATFSMETLTPSGGTFDYVELGSVLDIVTFTVPEPAAVATNGAALLVLLALARRRRR